MKLQEIKERIETGKTDFELPTLKGSEKQITWAMTLREKFLKSAIADVIEYDYDEDELQEVQDIITTNDASLIIAWSQR